MKLERVLERQGRLDPFSEGGHRDACDHVYGLYQVCGTIGSTTHELSSVRHNVLEFRLDSDHRASSMPLLEITVVGSFSRIGPTIRRRIDRLVASSEGCPGRLHGRRDRAHVRARAGHDPGAWEAGARVVLRGRDVDRLPASAMADADPRRRAVPDGRRRHGVAGLGPGRRRADPLVGDAARCRRRQRRGDVRRPRRRSRRDRVDLRGRSSSARSRSSMVCCRCSRDRRLAGHRGDVGWDVRAAARPRRPGVPRRAVLGCPRLRPGEARAGRAHARVVAAAGAGTGSPSAAMHPGWADTPGLANSLPASTGHAAAAPITRGRGRYDPLAGGSPGARIDQRATVPRPPAASVRPRAVNAAVARAAAPAVGPRGGDDGRGPTPRRKGSADEAEGPRPVAALERAPAPA